MTTDLEAARCAASQLLFWSNKAIAAGRGVATPGIAAVALAQIARIVEHQEKNPRAIKEASQAIQRSGSHQKTLGIVSAPTMHDAARVLAMNVHGAAWNAMGRATTRFNSKGSPGVPAWLRKADGGGEIPSPEFLENWSAIAAALQSFPLLDIEGYAVILSNEAEGAIINPRSGIAVDAKKRKKRPAFDRDHLFLKWHENENLTAAEIRDRWNDVPIAWRTENYPAIPGEVSRQTVEQAFTNARRELGRPLAPIIERNKMTQR